MRFPPGAPQQWSPGFIPVYLLPGICLLLGSSGVMRKLKKWFVIDNTQDKCDF
jgi:hypothetical protein